MITIKNHDIWIDFIFSIKGLLYQCKHTEELEDCYVFRFERLTGWNYPMFDITISRNRVSEGPMMYRIQSQYIHSPNMKGGVSYNTLTKDELRDKKDIEQKMLWVMDNSCG
jgi:hypothetical protein